jgi:hypothetical protein
MQESLSYKDLFYPYCREFAIKGYKYFKNSAEEGYTCSQPAGDIQPGGAMTATGSLRKDPLPENLAPLFAMQRTLMMQSEVPAAIPICVQIIAKEFPDSEVLACFPKIAEAMRIVAAPGFLKENSFQQFVGDLSWGTLEQENRSTSISAKECIEVNLQNSDRGPELFWRPPRSLWTRKVETKESQSAQIQARQGGLIRWTVFHQKPGAHRPLGR